jgi:hypothetical protein
MHRPKRLEIAAWGASILFAFAPMTYADDEPAAVPPPPRAATLDPVPPRTAAERWQRLKAQYSSQQGTRVEQPLRRGSVNGTDVVGPNGGDGSAPFRTIPAATDSGSGIGKAPAWQATGSANSRQAVLPSDPVTGGSRLIPAPLNNLDGLAPARIANLPGDGDLQNPASQPSPDDPVKSSESDVPAPAENETSNRGVPRTAGPLPIPSGPPRKATQVRPIADIAPVNDFDRDRDIRSFAATKAREFNVRFGGDQYVPRNFPDVAMQWQAPSTKYYPLYFQDWQMERYGHVYPFPLQPIVSNVRFGIQLVMMPYQMAITPPWEMQSPLGWYRPGDVVPKLHYQFPLSAKAAFVEAATVTGFYFLIP